MLQPTVQKSVLFISQSGRTWQEIFFYLFVLVGKQHFTLWRQCRSFISKTLMCNRIIPLHLLLYWHDFVQNNFLFPWRPYIRLKTGNESSMFDHNKRSCFRTGSSLGIAVNTFIYRRCYYTENLLKKHFLRSRAFTVCHGDSAQAKPVVGIWGKI